MYLRKVFFSSINLFSGIRSISTLQHKGIEVTLTQNPKPKPDWDNLIFGRNFSDHMLQIEWTEKQGWSTPKIVPYGNLSLSPATSCLHYAIECFEGMKAFSSTNDGKTRLFRPMKNMERFNDSAINSSLPTFDGAEFLECIKDLLRIDKDWIPPVENCSLYIRPTMIATEPAIGVQRSSSALLYCITGPVGPYFATGTFNPVKLYTDPSFVRAWKGGVGHAKMGVNYAPPIRIQDIATSKGCQQVLWLYGDDHQLTEVGTMNVFVHWVNEDGDPEIATPPLDGIILPGVIRDSLLQLGKTWGTYKITERTMTMADIIAAVNEGRMKEMFGAGTACVVCPISSILYLGEPISIPTMETGAVVTKRFYKELTDIQYGIVNHEWSVVID